MCRLSMSRLMAAAFIAATASFAFCDDTEKKSNGTPNKSLPEFRKKQGSTGTTEIMVFTAGKSLPEKSKGAPPFDLQKGAAPGNKRYVTGPNTFVEIEISTGRVVAHGTCVANLIKSPAKHQLSKDAKLAPAPGYKWKSGDGENREVIWSPGTPHSEFANVVAHSTEGQWMPAPGYIWSGESLHVILTPGFEIRQGKPQWSPGVPHPVIPNVVASSSRDHWAPAPGYVWGDLSSEKLSKALRCASKSQLLAMDGKEAGAGGGGGGALPNVQGPIVDIPATIAKTDYDKQQEQKRFEKAAREREKIDRSRDIESRPGALDRPGRDPSRRIGCDVIRIDSRRC